MQDKYIKIINDCEYNKYNHITCENIENGTAVVSAEMHPEGRNIWGVPSGALTYGIADEAAGLAAMSASGKRTMTISGTINYIFSNVTCTKVIARAKVSRAGSSIAYTTVQVSDQDGTLFAECQFVNKLFKE